MKRRDFLRTVGVTALGSWATRHTLDAAGQVTSALPDPAASGIEHVVVVMMENRSFDHLLGWLPKADGRQRGLKYVDTSGVVHHTYPLAPDYTGCGHPDPDHSYEGGRIEYDNGAMDGFLKGSNDEYAIGFYGPRDKPFFSALAYAYTTLDRSFCSILGPTFPNRFFMHAARTDRLENTYCYGCSPSNDLCPSELPTIWDSLLAAGVSCRYYFSNVPFLGLWGAKYLPVTATYPQFLVDAATGSLPAVSFVDPVFTLGSETTGGDDHPHADIRVGDAFLAQTFHAVASSPVWSSTVFIITYDEWGGFFEHVPPPRAAVELRDDLTIHYTNCDHDLVDGKALLGFRVPTVIASPWTRSPDTDPRVQHIVTDHTSILKLIEWRWGLAPLTARDASSDVQNLALALDFSNPNPIVPNLPTPIPPVPQACPGTGAATTTASSSPATRTSEWGRLLDSGLLAGWPLPAAR